MNRKHGMEALMGLGGGIVSEESRRNLDKAENLCRKKKPEQAIPYLMKAMQDGNNLDAVLQMAALMDVPDAIKVMESAAAQGSLILKKELGQDCFDDDGDCVGHFWGILETRPYMRVLQGLVQFYFQNRQYDKSEDTIIEMLRLCPGDNMGQRFWLGSILCHSGRYADALYFAQEWLGEKTRKTGEPPIRGGTIFKAPRRNFLTKLDEKELRWVDGSIMHTAALAAFKILGDCEDSRSYLEAAVQSNRHILLKVLACVRQPTGLNDDPRSMNGPEDAHDYLWLTQTLWMESDIWNWANNNPTVNKMILKTCSHSTCGAREVRAAEYKRCAACRLVSYCSAACQKDDWPNHKPACLDRKKQKAQMRAFR